MFRTLALRSQPLPVKIMLTLTAIVAYMLACIVALAFGARWVLKNDPLLKQQQLLDSAAGARAEDHPT
ncbi:hypothetical protein Cmtc_11610 [Cupriavidus sp. TKC]|nr:hypothetical protein D769_25390 [Cupriavidus sp. HMR-1]GMG89941.1 hypothetical protein Cmtc_11610 [Cupriavidus sp. TKC]HBD36008.1 hypothetical protein [Cupriavidus sp.]HBO77294.1 hypothetical protein [Cupriavidus sp.]